MLMSTLANRYAHQLLDARVAAAQLPPLSSTGDLSITDAYDIAKSILNIRIAQGEKPVGRKIGFSNGRVASKYGLGTPLWATMFDTTVRYTEDNHGIQSLNGAIQPRIEPEIVFMLGRTPAPDATIEELADCIEWMAHGYEIDVCPFPDWKFQEVDAIAAFGLHGALILGEPRVLSAATRRNLGATLANASVSLSCSAQPSFTLMAAGFGNEVQGNPVNALWQLHRQLQTQPQFSPLTAGEIITTGTWTDCYPVKPGQTWTTAFSGLSVAGLTLSFV